MNTSDSIVSSRTKQSSWRKSDTVWMLGLFSTAIGTGVLSSPIRVGFGGLIPIFLMLVLAYPIAFYCHWTLTRLCLSGSNPSGNTTETVEGHFGKTGGVAIAFLYFFVIRPLLWIYGITITNTFMTFWEDQFSFTPLNRDFMVLFLLLLMAFVIQFGKDLTVKVMSYLMWPFITSLVLISLSLIPYQNSAVTNQVDLGPLSLTGHDGILIIVWLGISIMVFSFNFSPIVSSFVVSKHEEYEKGLGRDFTERKCSQVISRAGMLMAVVMIFFAFNCLLALLPVNVARTRAQNVPVLSYLANHFASVTGTKTTFAITLEHAASITALVAIFESFFSHYLGTLEGLNGPVLKFGYKGDKTKVSLGKPNIISMIFIMSSTWIAAYVNPNILGLTETMDTPTIVSPLCLLSMYAIRKASSLAKYRGRLDNVFVTMIGLLTILNIVYELS